MTRESDFDTIVPILLYQNIFSLISNHFFEQLRLPKDFQFFKKKFQFFKVLVYMRLFNKMSTGTNAKIRNLDTISIT